MDLGAERDRQRGTTGGQVSSTGARPGWADVSGVADDDRGAVIAAQTGDRAAFETLARRHSARLRRILVRITGDPHLAEDALQDAFLRAWRNLAGFQGRSTFFTWMTRIAINEAYRSLERSEAKAALPLDDAVGERIPSWGADPDAALASRELLAVVDAALRRLPLAYRQAVVLRDVEGFTTREAAQMLGIEPRALKSRLHRGRMALRRELDAYFANGP